MNKVRLLSLDVSLTNTGLSVIDVVGRNPKVIYMCEIKTDSKLNYGRRLASLKDVITEVIKEYEPTHTVREAGIVRFNTATKAIYRAVGAVDIAVRNISEGDIETIAIGTAKKATTGSGNADKVNVGLAVMKIYGLDKDDLYTPRGRFMDDISDSLAVGYAYLVKNNYVDGR